jgi:hypothetical protein
MATPQRRKAIRAREAAEAASAGGSAVHAVTSVGADGRRAGPPQARPAPFGGSAVHEVTSVGASTPPDAGSEPPADPVAPVRKEP